MLYWPKSNISSPRIRRCYEVPEYCADDSGSWKGDVLDKQELAEMYWGFLAEQGYVPKIDDDGDVHFKFEGGDYFILIDEEDESYFRLAYPAFWPIENEEERIAATISAAAATAEVKVAKVYLLRDNTWAAVEMFCSPPEVFQAVFKRSLHAIQAAVECFRRTMTEA